MLDSADTKLASAIAKGDADAWTTFQTRYSDQILGAAAQACDACMAQGDHACLWPAIKANQPEPADSASRCQEGVALYRFLCRHLREQLGRYRGQSSLDAFVRVALFEGVRRYRLAHGQTGVTGEQPALAAAQTACLRDEEAAALAEQRLSEAEATAFAPHVAACPACSERVALLEQAPPAPIKTPEWLQRQGAAPPQPDQPQDSWRRKALSEPDWLLGLAIGGVITALCLIVVLPRLDYTRAVRDPSDQQIAKIERSLDASSAAHLQAARQELAKGQVDAAIANLVTVLSARPDNLEARWLLASTYERVGDRTGAGQQYRIFVDVDARERTIMDARLKHAKARLGMLEAMP